MRLSFAIVVSFLATAGCKNKEEESSTPAPVKIEKLGLEIDLPGKAKIGELDGTVTLNGKAFGEIFLDVETTPVNIEDLKKSTPGKEVSNFQSESLSDGVLVTYDYKMGSTTATSVETHRALGGKQISCKANSSDKPWLTAATAACKSLRASK